MLLTWQVRVLLDVLSLIFQAAKLGVKFFDELFSRQFLTASAIDATEPQQHVGNCPLVARTKLAACVRSVAELLGTRRREVRSFQCHLRARSESVFCVFVTMD
jgi:hypothetical protein